MLHKRHEPETTINSKSELGERLSKGRARHGGRAQKSGQLAGWPQADGLAGPADDKLAAKWGPKRAIDSARLKMARDLCPMRGCHAGHFSLFVWARLGLARRLLAALGGSWRPASPAPAQRRRPPLT